MMLKSVTLGFCAVMALADVALAVPVICPDANLIKATGFADAGEAWEHIYNAYNQSTYNTNHEWMFVLGGIQAPTKERALEKANKMLPRLSGSPLPERDGAEWTCNYSGFNKNYLAVAVTYERNPLVSASMMQRFANRSRFN